MRLSLIVLLLISISLNLRQQETVPTKEDLARAPLVKIEELVAHPEHFDNQIVRVNALWVNGYHGAVVCPIEDKRRCIGVIVWPETERGLDTKRVLDQNLKAGPSGEFWDMEAQLSVVGRFKDTKERARNNPRFVLEVQSVEGILPKPTESKFKHHATIVTNYDKAKDQTAVVMQWYNVVWPSGFDIYNRGSALDREKYDLDIQAAFSYPGRVIRSTPKLVQLELRVRHPGQAFLKSTDMPELIVQVDGEAISFGRTELVRTKTFVDVEDGQLSYEQLSAYFTYAGLQRLINAQKVSMKVGEIELKLEDRHLEAFRDLATRMLF